MGSFIENRINTSNRFLDNVRSMRENTLNFENISYREKYVNEDINYMKTSEKNLVYFSNILQEKYLSRIIERRRKTSITSDQKNEFDMNPYLAARVLLGNADYWWILLLVNRKMNVQQFTKLGDYIYTPDMEDIKECIIKELNKNKNLGVLV